MNNPDLSSVMRYAAFALAALPALCQDVQLPMGDAPAPVESRHFPDRVHEFIWRNWDAVEPDKLARIIGATEEDIIAVAQSMGLPAFSGDPETMLQRGYVTLIRRNWHLLPYDQLLELLEMTPERLDHMLREEDFLWVKLGRRKPASEPLKYSAPNEAARVRAAEIRAVVEGSFGDVLLQPREPRFDFVKQLSQPDPSLSVNAQDKSDVERLVYSYVAVYGDPLLNPELNPYPDGLLQRLAASGVNGVWLQGVLRDLAPGGPELPEFGEGHEARLAALRGMVDRAKQYGISVYLYINEPRAMPAAFYAGRPDMAGVQEAELTAMCTSHPAVCDWMRNALAHVFREVPDLGGIYAITASENLTNCASHGGWTSCPRCRERTDADILTEVVEVLEAGVHAGSPDASVLISDWGWRGHGDAPDIIERLPENVTLMSVSEWHLPIERGGVASTVGEYSISSVGPGPRSQAHWKVARDRALKIGTEIQFNNTCEIASIPYLPVLDLIGEHCRNLQPFELNAMLIGWTMGGYPSPNFQLAERMSRTPRLDMNAALDDLARARFGEEGAPHARKAWTLTSEAFREYPFHISVVYTCPVQWGAANPVYAEKTGYSATMWGIPYDDLNGWRGPYPPDVFADQFERVAKGWQPGIEALQEAVRHAPPDLRNGAEADLRYARAAAIHFQAVANQSRFVHARDQLADSTVTVSDAERENLLATIDQTLRSEIDLARELYTLVQQDSRIGFEPSCQYFYLPLDLVEKVVNCRWLLDYFDMQKP
ncbi:MAG: hypothetical protein AMXMBFR82_43140 [Candidatus Hydrogenedentota bacterium]